MKGFSLLEFISMFAILLVITAIVVGGFVMFKRGNELTLAKEHTLSQLTEAKTRTLAAYQNAAWGAHMETDRVILFKGSYVSGNPENETAMLPTDVEISSIALNGGGSDVIFKRLSGETDQYGTITLRIKNDPAKTRTITMESNGNFY
jgi:hypothetical protein